MKNKIYYKLKRLDIFVLRNFQFFLELRIYITDLNIISAYIDNIDIIQLTSNNQRKLTLRFLEKHINKNWNWTDLSINNIITPTFIEKYIDKPWDWYSMHFNKSVTKNLNFIEKYIDKPWYFKGLIYHVPETFIEKHIDKPWFCESTNLEYFSLKFIEKYLYKLDAYRISKLKNIKPIKEIVDKLINSERISIESLINNKNFDESTLIKILKNKK